MEAHNKAYGHSRIIADNFDAVLGNLTTALKEEGFGILTEINVREKMKEKLNKDMDPYLILGACNPQLAFQSLQAEQEVGLLLPCNVIIYQKADKVAVSTILPTVAMSIVDNPKLKAIAQQAEEKLIRAINNI